MNDIQNKQIINQIEQVVKEAQSYVVSTVNIVLLKSYLKIGEIISDSKNISLRELERELKPKYGEGFSRRNLNKMIIFFKDYGSGATLSPHLSWSHYFLLLDIQDLEERGFFLISKGKDHKTSPSSERPSMFKTCNNYINRIKYKYGFRKEF